MIALLSLAMGKEFQAIENDLLNEANGRAFTA